MSLDRTERIRLPRHDSGIKQAVDKRTCPERLEQDSADRTAEKGRQERIARIGQLKWDSWDRTAGTGQPGQES
jgi:hypothetical protein